MAIKLDLKTDRKKNTNKIGALVASTEQRGEFEFHLMYGEESERAEKLSNTLVPIKIKWVTNKPSS